MSCRDQTEERGPVKNAISGGRTTEYKQREINEPEKQRLTLAPLRKQDAPGSSSNMPDCHHTVPPARPAGSEDRAPLCSSPLRSGLAPQPVCAPRTPQGRRRNCHLGTETDFRPDVRLSGSNICLPMLTSRVTFRAPHPDPRRQTTAPCAAG